MQCRQRQVETRLAHRRLLCTRELNIDDQVLLSTASRRSLTPRQFRFEFLAQMFL